MGIPNSCAKKQHICKNWNEYVCQDINTVVKWVCMCVYVCLCVYVCVCISDSRACARSLIQLLTIQVKMYHKLDHSNVRTCVFISPFHPLFSSFKWSGVSLSKTIDNCIRVLLLTLNTHFYDIQAEFLPIQYKLSNSCAAIS